MLTFAANDGGRATRARSIRVVGAAPVSPSPRRTLIDEAKAGALMADALSPRAGRGVPRSWVVCLGLAAAARLLLQVLAMPPYAGLDEAYHVARVAYVGEEGRQPVAHQLSVPLYLEKSIAGEPDAPPAFGTIGGGWPAHIAARPEGWKDVPLDRATRREYVKANYEVQQPSPYYLLMSPIEPFFATQLGQLLALRLLAVLFGVATVVSTGLLAVRLWGSTGLLAGLLLLVTPTWVTLVARAGNDAPACAALALALLLSTLPDGSWRMAVWESVCWASAIALKVYAWPAALLLPLLWPKGAGRSRRALTASAVVVAALLTALDLLARTGNPIGSIAFWGGDGLGLPGDSLDRLARLPWLQFLKVFVGSAIWTSGQHGNFLRPGALGLFILPWLVLASAALLEGRSMPIRAVRLLVAAAAVFSLAEVGQAWGYLREAALGRLQTQSAGMAGWYLHAFDPLWFGVGLGFAVASLKRRRWTLVLVLAVFGALAGDVFVTEGALFRDYAGLSSPLTPGAFFRWGGGQAWEALVRLGRYGLWLPSPWLAVMLRALEVGLAAVLVALSVRSPRSGEAGSGNIL